MINGRISALVFLLREIVKSEAFDNMPEHLQDAIESAIEENKLPC
jgi:hypothetical protein